MLNEFDDLQEKAKSLDCGLARTTQNHQRGAGFVIAGTFLGATRAAGVLDAVEGLSTWIKTVPEYWCRDFAQVREVLDHLEKLRDRLAAPTEAVLEKIRGKEPRVLIEVRGGVGWHNQDPGVRVELIDYDNEPEAEVSQEFEDLKDEVDNEGHP